MKPNIKILMDLYATPRGSHAQEIMKELGIEYSECEPSPITDSWSFYGINLATLPVELPSYLQVREIGIDEWNRRVELRKSKKEQTKQEWRNTIKQS